MKPPGFYVSVVDGARSALVDGPHPTHGAALARVDTVREEWAERDARSHFYAWGTARVFPEAATADALRGAVCGDPGCSECGCDDDSDQCPTCGTFSPNRCGVECAGAS